MKSHQRPINGVKFAIVLILLVAASSMGYAQYMSSNDPCAIYPHQSVNIPQGTPTAKLVAGKLGQRIYVCGMVIPNGANATPGVTLSYGEVVAATPCATSTPGATIGVFGGGAANATGTFGTFNTTMAVVPAAVATPVVDLCGLVSGGTGVPVGGGILTYVQGP